MTFEALIALSLSLWWLFCVVMSLKNDDWNWFLWAIFGLVPICIIGGIIENFLI